MLGNVIRVTLNLKLGNLLRVLRRKRTCHHAFFCTVWQIPVIAGHFSKNVNAFASLVKPVFAAVHNMPFNRITQVSHARKDNREITAALRRRTFEQTINVLEQHVLRLFQMQETIDVPPKNALLALDSASSGQRFRHTVILARKATDDHLNIGNIDFTGLAVIENLVDVLVNAATFTETLLIAAPSELLALGSRRLPLIGPDCFERSRCRKIELRMLEALVAFKAKAKSANASKKLGHRNRHVPILYL